VAGYKTFQAVPARDQANVRNDMYLTAAALKQMEKTHNPSFTSAESAALKNYQGKLDKSTKFIPDWVKVAVALALGLGTMVGWKRIVMTVGEKIGKEHMTYAQGASAALVTMGTIFAADTWGLPVSTTHILSSGVAGTMAANGSGLRWMTVRNIAAGWVLHAAGRGCALGSALLPFPHVLLKSEDGSQKGVRRGCGRLFCRPPAAAAWRMHAQIFNWPSHSVHRSPISLRGSEFHPPTSSDGKTNLNPELNDGGSGNDC
jgi:hypothetical protein